MPRYLALLRGINVGGNNLIRMKDLKTCFEAQGLEDVVTYIQSGNVLFSSDERSAAALTARIEQTLASTFDYKASLLLRTQKQMREIVAGAPDGFGESPDLYRYDVIFLYPTLESAETLKVVPMREGVDEGHAGPGVLYYSRLVAKAAQSRLTKLISMPIYKSVTIRNWNTTTKLLQLMETPGKS
jgi:uncharacterized protein (DUF1697 family)